MIDLDALAEKRADELGQEREPWVRAAWSADFQRLSQNLSDGEIETFFTSCKSAEEFQIMTSLLFESVSVRGVTFGEILGKVSRTGFLLADWFEALVAAKKWSDQRQLAVAFFEYLVFVNACALRATKESRPLMDEIREALRNNKLGHH